MKRKSSRATLACRQLAAVVVLACGLSAGPVHAEGDAFVCMEESQEKCDYENKNMELFIKGRDAFDRGREIGDLSEAHAYAAELIERKDVRHGQALMKFIYVQVGQGVHKNLVEGYRWVASDIAAGTTYKRLDLQRILDQLAARMTPEQLAEAKAVGRWPACAWRPRTGESERCAAARRAISSAGLP